MTKTKKAPEEGALEKFIIMIFVMLWHYIWGVVRGFYYLPWKKLDTYGGLAIWGGIVYLIAVDAHHINFMKWIVPELKEIGLTTWLRSLGLLVNFWILYMLPLSFFFLFWGEIIRGKKRLNQSNLDRIGIKNPKGEYATFVEEIKVNKNEKNIVIKAPAIADKDIWDKKSHLENFYGMPLVDVVFKKDKKQVITLMFSNKVIDTLYRFDESNIGNLEEYEFIVGKSIDTIVKQKLHDLPHMMISGSTNKGKSNFFHLTIYQLLKFNHRSRLYFLDLKQGVEARPYKELPNAKIASTEEASLSLLEEIHEEMILRLKYLEENNLEKLLPNEHNLDLIILAIDEASVLFGKPVGNDKKKETIAKARELSDEIAKLGRAASIHMIIATQKVIKETIDTRVQENISGRMCFKTETPINSMMVLGNTLGHTLPSTKGRAIWKVGSECIEVQAPLFDRKNLLAKIKTLGKGIEEENFKEVGMLKIKQDIIKKKDQFIQTDKPVPMR